MAMICDKCKGVIPDISFGHKPWDCSSHIKPQLDIDMDKWHGRPQLKCDAILGENVK